MEDRDFDCKPFSLVHPSTQSARSTHRTTTSSTTTTTALKHPNNIRIHSNRAVCVCVTRLPYFKFRVSGNIHRSPVSSSAAASMFICIRLHALLQSVIIEKVVVATTSDVDKLVEALRCDGPANLTAPWHGAVILYCTVCPMEVP